MSTSLRCAARTQFTLLTVGSHRAGSTVHFHDRISALRATILFTRMTVSGRSARAPLTLKTLRDHNARIVPHHPRMHAGLDQRRLDSYRSDFDKDALLL